MKIARAIAATLTLALLVTATAAPARAAGPGPVAHWAAEGDARDSAGTNHGVAQERTRYITGVVGTAFAFGGRGAQSLPDATGVLIPDAPALDPTAAITVATWVRVNRGTGDRDIVSKDGEGFDRQYLLTASGAERFRAHIGVPSGFMWFDGSTPVAYRTWTHVAMTYDGSTLRLYVNGTPDGAMAVSGPIITTSQPVRLGGGAPPGQAQLPLVGAVDEVRIYDRALTECAIGELAGLGPCPERGGEILAAVAADLEGLAGKDVERAGERLARAAEADLWIDPDRVDPKHGHRVFSEIRKAAKDLTKADLGPTGAEAIDRLLEVQRLLAAALIDEAATATHPDRQDKVDREVARARDDLAAADAERASGDPSKASDHYRKAWEHASSALAHADRP